ncbi:hypothetical protein A2115_03505 [Candidatus Woesebacteria bacterium GWA1_41_8]|uniref:Uncharacterized protein n=1 Tax=Candidatus Woesebacteria bacterium GWA1_41_8 TaxID=1802471 RepID=A0A1F7WIP6_9BACT|nr:MAG: hypothetical protein A2115_03505 [Candidatus Woesebacteria bacterium GWA1_41_8]
MVKKVDRKLNNQKLKSKYPIKVTLDCDYVSRLIGTYKREIEESLNEVKRHKNIDKIITEPTELRRLVLCRLTGDLSVLEQLIECYLDGRDGKTDNTGFNAGDGLLYGLLEEIRRFIKEFPPHLEIFYQNYIVYYKEHILPKSAVCKICNERGANHRYANATVHPECFEKVNAKYCENCTNLYLSGEINCTSKPECANYHLKEAKAEIKPDGVMSSKFLYEINKQQQVKHKILDRGRQIVKFTRKEIGILKAALQYYWLDDEFGYMLWLTVPGATTGSMDLEYAWRVGDIVKKLNGATKTKVKENYGHWGNIERLFKLCDKALKKAKWYASKEWEQMRILSELKNNIYCPECGKENKPEDLKFDYDKSKINGWYYLKCVEGHPIKESPIILLGGKSTKIIKAK